VDELALATLCTVVAAPAEPTDGDAVTDREILDTRTDFGDLAGDFVAQSQRPGQTGETNWASVPQMPQAPTLIRTSPRAGDVVSTSASSSGAPADFT
jgi:hypothetical protein